MGLSMLDAQKDLIIHTIRSSTRGDWKVLVLDVFSKKLLDNVVKEDDILNENITHIEQIEHKRQRNPDVDAVYLLSPQPHIVDCVMADFERRRYRRSNLIWTSLLHPTLRERIDKSPVAREQIATFKVLNMEFFPRESHLVTFRDPWEFPVLFHPDCNHLVRKQMEDIAQKIVGVCVALGEYPTIRYYKPKMPTHEANVLCTHLARFVQDELDLYAKFHQDFPPPNNRPRGVCYILDRSMDVNAPFIHEFTYQAMAFDLLPIREGEKITYKTIVNEGRPNQESKDVEISEKDKIWVENRHRHMKDTIEKLMGDFQRFIDDNPHFTKQDSDNANSLNAIKDMMAGLPQFQEMKEAYSLHLSMAQESMNIFQHQKLPDIASVEQILATGLDEDYKKPKNLTDQVVRTLDDEGVSPPDRLRLLALYLIYRDGMLPADLSKLINHAQLPAQDNAVLENLALLGIRTRRNLKDSRPKPIPLFPPIIPTNLAAQEEYALSRFEPALKSLLTAHVTNTVDPLPFPYTRPPLDADDSASAAAQSATSLRTAKPTWAKTKTTSSEPRQRIIVYMAGGATYAESRSCYEISAKHNKEVVLVTSHMQTPGLFMRQLADLSADRRRLGIPAEQPPPQAPAHLFEKESPPKVLGNRPDLAGQGRRSTFDEAAKMKPPEVPNAGMAGLRVGDGGGVGRQNGMGAGAQAQGRSQTPPMHTVKLGKEPDKDKKKGKMGGLFHRSKDK